MCFSPEVSFGSAAALLAAGVYSWRTTRRRCPRLWPVALVPSVFGLQQATEGVVWLGLNAGNEPLAREAARVYLFFALAFWPVWFSLAAVLIERTGRRRAWLAGWAVLSTAWLWVVYLPIAVDPDGVTVHVSRHSVRYDTAWTERGWSSAGTRWVVRGWYVLTVAAPLAVTSARRVLLPSAGAGLAAAGVAAVVYDHAFTSVWCLFAAVLSGALAWALRTAPPNCIP